MTINFSNKAQLPNSAHNILVTAADDGTFLPLDQLTHTLGFAGGQLVTDSVTLNNGLITLANPTGTDITYIQTMTYSGSTLVTVGPWVKQ